MTKTLQTIADLTPDEHNANRGTVRGRAMIEASIRECGAGRSIVVDREGRVIGGNKTLDVIEKLGIPVQIVPTDGKTLVVVQRTDLDLESDPRARRLAYLDNRTTDVDLEWDVETIAADLEAGIELGDLFDKGELDEILAGLEPEPGEAPEAQIDRAEELQQKWQTARGQLWEIGKHRLLCGDSLDIEDIRRVVGGGTVNMVFADPPYGIEIVATNVSVGGGEGPNGMIPFGGVKNRKGLGSVGGAKPFGSQKVRGTVGAAHIVDVGKYAPVIGDDSTDTAIQASTALLAEYPKAVHVWWGGNYYANALAPSSCWLVWDKETTGNFADCELAWTNQDKAARLFRHQWNGMLRASEHGRRVHPTQKPAALALWAYQTLGKEGDVVLDPFCGAGMSMAAAEQSGRSVRALELSPDYVAVTLERMAAMGLEPRLLSNSPKG